VAPWSATAGVVVLAVVAGGAAALWPLGMVLVVASAVVVGIVALHPPAAAYILLGTTPLAVGLGRGSVLPLLRPNEAIALVLGAGLVLRGLVGLATGRRLLHLRFTAVEGALAALACTGSFVPLVWMLARGVPITGGDLLYASVLWKYFGIYLLVRTAVRTEREVARCLGLTLAVYGVVAMVGLLQVLRLFGVPHLIARWYAGEVAPGLEIRRATATLASWLAMADVMIFSLAIAAGWLVHRSRPRPVLVGAMVLFALGCLAAGEVSGLVALVAGAFAFGAITGRGRQVRRVLVPFLLAAALVLSPVIEARLHAVDRSSGLPLSWVGRRDNLERRILPEFRSVGNVLLGVRPAARVPAPEELGEPWVYVESGHLWLLWTGGIPMLVAFFVFLIVALRAVAPIARRRRDAIGVAATASFVALVVLAVGTVFDPHLTHRGTADLNFALLALALTGCASRPGVLVEHLAGGAADPGRCPAEDGLEEVGSAVLRRPRSLVGDGRVGEDGLPGAPAGLETP